jgi:hypothetical protein
MVNLQSIDLGSTLQVLTFVHLCHQEIQVSDVRCKKNDRYARRNC